MFRNRLVTSALVTSLTLTPVLTGCDSLPGGPKEQGTAIGGLSGAAAGAALYKQNRLLGALVGGALGAGGGYLIGANWDKINGKKKDEAEKASRTAEAHPAKASDVQNAKTADLNDDGFVTLDEVVAMSDAGLSTKEQINRLERTQQYFELTSEQEQYLRDHGVKSDVVVAMRDMNQDVRQASERTSSSSSEGSSRVSHSRSSE